MVIRLIHETPDLLAGAAVISATQPVQDNFAPNDPRDEPLPVMLIHGTKDPITPYDGGMASMWGFSPRGLGMSAAQTAHYYAQRNKITSAPVAESVVPAGTGAKPSVEALHYRQPGHAPVSLYTVHGGGHTIPGTRKAPFVLGRTDMTFDAVAAVADHFHLRAGADR
jgi:polyhydroxybutyrate depolymerase